MTIILIIIFAALATIGIISALQYRKHQYSKEGVKPVSKKEIFQIEETKTPIIEEPVHKIKIHEKIMEEPQKTAEISLKEKEKELKKTESEIGIVKPKIICIVHKGPIVGNVYVCPHCQTFYCQNCVKALKRKGEKCWSCDKEFE